MKQSVAFITNEFPPFRGGVATYVREVAHALHRLGSPVSVLTVGQDSVSQSEQLPFPVTYLGSTMRSGTKDQLRLAWGYWLRKCTLMNMIPLFISYRALMAGIFLRKLKILPALEYGLILHGSELLRVEHSPMLMRPMLMRMTSGFFSDARFVAASSQQTLERLIKSPLGTSIGKVGLVPCAAPRSLVEASPGGRPPSGRIHILTLARIHPRKGQVDSAKALARLPFYVKKNIEYQIAGCGDADYLARVLDICKRGHVPVRVMGQVPEHRLSEVYSQAHIYMMSCRTLAKSIEGFGITYLEAGLFELPVVGYRSGGVEEAVVNEKSGLLVKEGDIDGLMNAVLSLIEKPSMRTRMGRAGREHALSFSWEQSARKLTALCNPQI